VCVCVCVCASLFVCLWVCACAYSIIIFYKHFIFIVFWRHLFNELIYRFLVNNNRRARGRWRCVKKYIYIYTLYGVCLVRGVRKKTAYWFSSSSPAARLQCLCLPCASLPPRRRVHRHRGPSPPLTHTRAFLRFSTIADVVIVVVAPPKLGDGNDLRSRLIASHRARHHRSGDGAAPMRTTEKKIILLLLLKNRGLAQRDSPRNERYVYNLMRSYGRLLRALRYYCYGDARRRRFNDVYFNKTYYY
jgi:hypothetical protein